MKMSNPPKRWPHISSRADLPKREFHSWRGMKEPTTDIYYREGTEVYVETKGSEPMFVCNCDTDEWADYIISCLGIRDLM